jgi:hypothetical protein
MSQDVANPRVKMTNSMPWVSELLSASQATASLNLTRDKFIKYMNQAIKGTLRAQAKLSAG